MILYVESIFVFLRVAFFVLLGLGSSTSPPARLKWCQRKRRAQSVQHAEGRYLGLLHAGVNLATMAQSLEPWFIGSLGQQPGSKN